MSVDLEKTNLLEIPYDRTLLKWSCGKLVFQGQSRQVAVFTKANGNLTINEIEACQKLIRELSKYHEGLAYDPNHSHVFNPKNPFNSSFFQEAVKAKEIFLKEYPSIHVDGFIINLNNGFFRVGSAHH